ncbi:MAG: L-serine ammonia-lyase, iron-sulfur-dependent, subunit alpha [Bacteroidales bacterium]|nr:L-serine ammonia-lyase, iron-sulfur-dependent, subunit alpha [Bacteroidales bacterium]
METIKKIYKIGYGPSSSHTMGPNRAAEMFAARTKQASRYRVTLYGSLAATGKGHHTDMAITRGLSPKEVEIVWRADIVKPFHPNGMFFEALDAEGQVIDSWLVYSIGGGYLATEEGDVPMGITPEGEVYPHSTMKEIMEYIDREGLSFWEYVEQCEDGSLWFYLEEMWRQMQQTIEEGLQDDRVIAGGLHLRSKAHQYFIRASAFKPSLQSRALVIAYALATSEQNACGARIVTAPTCGSSGVLPAVLYHLKKNHDFSDREILRAMATAGLFANVIKTNATISGAEAGCQAEVGSACVMAAVASNQLFGGSPKQIEYAAEMAMEHNLGLTCDPLCGLVQIPCIERNAMAALRALDINIYAMMSDGRHIISFDKVVRTMKLTGHDLPSLYKETSLGGLALND